MSSIAQKPQARLLRAPQSKHGHASIPPPPSNRSGRPERFESLPVLRRHSSSRHTTHYSVTPPRLGSGSRAGCSSLSESRGGAAPPAEAGVAGDRRPAGDGRRRSLRPPSLRGCATSSWARAPWTSFGDARRWRRT